MLESMFIFFVVANLSLGVAEDVVIPVANKAISTATPLVEQAIDYVKPSTPDK